MVCVECLSENRPLLFSTALSHCAVWQESQLCTDKNRYYTGVTCLLQIDKSTDNCVWGDDRETRARDAVETAFADFLLSCLLLSRILLEDRIMYNHCSICSLMLHVASEQFHKPCDLLCSGSTDALPLLLVGRLVKLREHVESQANATHAPATQIFTKCAEIYMMRAWSSLSESLRICLIWTHHCTLLGAWH